MTRNEDDYSYRSYDRSGYRARTSGSRRATGAPKHSSLGASNSKSRSGGAGKGVKIGLVVAILILAAMIFGITRLVPSCSSGVFGSSTSIVNFGAANDEASERVSLPTPYIAEGGGIKLHSAVPVENLTEILIHNASYSYADELTTQLTEATNTVVMENHGTGRVASEQPTGDQWMTGEFIRCFRSGNAGPTMSAIDCGGTAGDTVYAPVSGTVVKVKNYDLYGNADYKDIQIHIQPEGREDLDVVLIHLENAQVEEGDVVEGGVTPIASIRDVYAYIGDEMQLKDYTAEGDNGNHTHIQINDATNKEYHGLD